MASYKVLQGIDYGDKRAEAGDVVDDIPAKSIKWLLDQQIIEVVEGSKKRTAKTDAPEPEETPEEDGE